MAQTDTATARIDRLGHPSALIVSPAMLHTREHRTDELFRLDANNPRNTTHFVLFCASLWLLDPERLTLAERIEHAKRRAAGCFQLIEADRSGASKHARTNRAHLRLLTFVLCFQCH